MSIKNFYKRCLFILWYVKYSQVEKKHLQKHTFLDNKDKCSASSDIIFCLCNTFMEETKHIKNNCSIYMKSVTIVQKNICPYSCHMLGQI